MKKFYFGLSILFCLLFSSQLARAAYCNINGYIVDDCSGAGIVGLEITIYSFGSSTVTLTTGAGGYFVSDYNFLCDQSYSISAVDGPTLGSWAVNSPGHTFRITPRSYFTIDGLSHYLQNSNWTNNLVICETTGEVVLRTKPIAFVSKYFVIIREDNAGVEGGILSSDSIEVDMGKPCAGNVVLGDVDITSLVAQHGTGNYYVKFWTKGCCGNVSPSVEWARIHVDVQQTLDIDFNYGASTTLEAAVPDGNSSDLLRIRSSNYASPTVCGANSISLKGIDITNNSIQDYTIVIYESNCSTGAKISELYNSGPLSGSGGQLPDFDLDAEFVYTPTNHGWFQAATLGEIAGVTTNGKCYKVEVVVTNLCDDPKNQHGYFTIYQENSNARIVKNYGINGKDIYLKGTTHDGISDDYQIKVSPNPTKDWLKLEDLPENCIINIVDLNGKIVMKVMNHHQKIVSIDLGNLTAGIYLAKIIGSNIHEVIPVNKF